MTKLHRHLKQSILEKETYLESIYGKKFIDDLMWAAQFDHSTNSVEGCRNYLSMLRGAIFATHQEKINFVQNQQI